jgi:ABC-type glycerol-3-phosphate transport system substrate-binding protein
MCDWSSDVCSSDLDLDYYAEIDWANQVAMVKDGQVMSQLCPDWLYGIHQQGTAADTEFLANSPMRITRIPDFSAGGPHSGTWGGTGCSVPKMTPQRQLAVEVMLYMYFEDGDGQMAKRYKDTGILPPVKASWDHPGFHEEEAYLGGQIGAEVFIAAANDLPGYSENWKTSLVTESWDEQFPLLWNGEIGIDQAIEAADKSARDKIAQNE